MPSPSHCPNCGTSPEYLTPAAVAAQLHIGIMAAIHLCETHQIRASNRNATWLIDPADLAAYVAAGLNEKSAA